MNNHCPESSCQSDLRHQEDRGFDLWSCEVGHGAGVTIDSAWNRLQKDEIRAIWDGAKAGYPSSFLSPALRAPMVGVDFVADDDNIEGNQGTNARDARAFVSIDERFIWFPSDDPSDTSKVLSGLTKAIGNLL